MATTPKRPTGPLHLLTAKQVQHAQPGDSLADGGGLVLRIDPTSAAWSLRYTAPSGRRREMGLRIPVDRSSVGKAQASLDAARELAHEARDLLRRGVDPIDAREAAREAAVELEAARKAERARQRLTLARAARDYHARVIEPSRTPKHAAQWIASLENHMPPEVWGAPIDTIDAPALLRALLAIRPHERARHLTQGERLPETLRRIRQRLDAIFEDAIFHGHATTNPAAAIRRKLAEEGPARPDGQFAALPYREAPAFLQRLRTAEGTAARCLEFAMLTAARTGEVLACEWVEINSDAGLWTVPAARMKAREEHAVYLSDAALQVLQRQRGQGARLVFPTPADPRADKPLSNMAMLTLLDRLGVRDRTTVHGLCRATFSTWAYETAAARPDVIEACLAHRESDKIKAAYNRAQFADERRALLRAWAEYLTKPPAVVVPIGTRAA